MRCFATVLKDEFPYRANDMAMDNGGGGSRGGGEERGRLVEVVEMWQCSQCGRNNFMDRVFCFACRRSRGGESPSGGGGLEEGSDATVGGARPKGNGKGKGVGRAYGDEGFGKGGRESVGDGGGGCLGLKSAPCSVFSCSAKLSKSVNQ